jgi:hypothetical protein
MNILTRYIRAFIVTLRLTLRGQQPPGLRHPELYAWIKQMLLLVDAVYSAADQNGLDKKVREATTVKLDGRSMSLETAFQTLRYHAGEEYLSLLRNSTNSRHNLSAIYAGNMNDRYWLMTLQAEPSLQNPAVHAALVQLSTHLDSIPATTSKTAAKT